MMLAKHRRARPSPGRSRRLPKLETDLHGYVLARLDAHLADLHALERELTQPRPSHPDARRQAALAAAVAAQAFAQDLGRALSAAAVETPARRTGASHDQRTFASR